MEYVQILFDDLAKRYDFFCQVASFSLDHFWRRKINSFIEVGEIVLDLGSGTGALAFTIYKAKRIIGIDFSWEMLKSAQLKNQTQKSDPKTRLKRQTQRIDFIAADVQEIPFSAGSFNSVMSSFVFRHLKKNINAALEEIYRVIKPEGKIIILEFSRPEFAFLKKIYYLYLEKVIPLIGRILFGKEKVKYFHYFKETIIDFFSPEELKAILSRAGFREVKYYPSIGGIIGIYYGFK